MELKIIIIQPQNQWKPIQKLLTLFLDNDNKEFTKSWEQTVVIPGPKPGKMIPVLETTDHSISPVSKLKHWGEC